MTTRMDEERRRDEYSERFLSKMEDMIAKPLSAMDQKYVPRPELEARFDHLEQIVADIGVAVKTVTSNVGSFHENVPRIYADKSETKQSIAELHTDIAKLETAFEAFKERQYGSRFEDMQGRYRGDERVERGWRKDTQQQSTQMLSWVIGGGLVLFTVAVNIMLALTRP
jgi:antirestriction protein